MKAEFRFIGKGERVTKGDTLLVDSGRGSKLKKESGKQAEVEFLHGVDNTNRRARQIYNRFVNAKTADPCEVRR